MRLDHLVLATPDPESTIAELLAATGVQPSGGGPHVGLGTRNWLAAIVTADDADRVYLEVIGPDPEQPEPESPRPFGVDELHTPSFAWWCARAEDIDSLASSTETFGPPIEMRRAAPEGELTWKLSFPSDLGGAVPFVIDWMDSPHPALTAPRGLRLDAMVIESPDPETVTSDLGALGSFPIEVVSASEPALRATLSGPAGSYSMRSASTSTPQR